MNVSSLTVSFRLVDGPSVPGVLGEFGARI
jgi:hypothetical protein